MCGRAGRKGCTILQEKFRERLRDAKKVPGARILDGRFTAVQQAVCTPKGRDAGANYLREFVEDVKATGLVARIIEKNGVRGVTVAAGN